MDKKKINTKTMIYIVRHGETDWNVNHIMQGQLNIPLNDKGRAQVRAIAVHLKEVHFDVCYASPLSRAYETATIINSYHHVPILKETAIMERHFGVVQRKTYAEVYNFHPAMLFGERWNYPDYKPQGGESANDVKNRAIKFVKHILKKNKGKSVLIVSHGDFLRSVIAALLGIHPKTLMDVYAANSGLSLIEIKNGQPTVHVVNYLPRQSV
ncbi:MAG: histidine phosphatase family protein [Candidatus Gottesmanbacteria bacterium]|nr:histidine phosphatase family protein [Candidatus Gottesmanbacteria bacterium]